MAEPQPGWVKGRGRDSDPWWGEAVGGMAWPQTSCTGGGNPATQRKGGMAWKRSGCARRVLPRLSDPPCRAWHFGSRTGMAVLTATASLPHPPPHQISWRWSTPVLNQWFSTILDLSNPSRDLKHPSLTFVNYVATSFKN